MIYFHDSYRQLYKDEDVNRDEGLGLGHHDICCVYCRCEFEGNSTKHRKPERLESVVHILSCLCVLVNEFDKLPIYQHVLCK